MVNVLQALFLTDGDKMLQTPTYYVFDMYKVHQDATMLPVEFNSPTYSRLGKSIPSLSASASRDKNGAVHVSFVNIDPAQSVEISCNLKDVKGKLISANIITAPKIDTYNTFENPNQVVLKEFKNGSFKNGTLKIKIPEKSVVTVEIK